MRLHEEYISRHHLEVPVVRYDSRSSIFLKTKQSPCAWRVLSIQWREGGHHPGFFEVNYMMPKHNGYQSGDLLLNVLYPVNLYWEEYEQGILDLVADIRSDYVAVLEEESLSAAWQMFLVMHDTLFAHFSHGFFADVERSTSTDLDVDERRRAFKTAEKHVDLVAPRTYESWKYQVAPLANLHSKWLEDLINA